MIRLFILKLIVLVALRITLWVLLLIFFPLLLLFFGVLKIWYVILSHWIESVPGQQLSFLQLESQGIKEGHCLCKVVFCTLIWKLAIQIAFAYVKTALSLEGDVHPIKCLDRIAVIVNRVPHRLLVDVLRLTHGPRFEVVTAWLLNAGTNIFLNCSHPFLQICIVSSDVLLSLLHVLLDCQKSIFEFLKSHIGITEFVLISLHFSLAKVKVCQCVSYHYKYLGKPTLSLSLDLVSKIFDYFDALCRILYFYRNNKHYLPCVLNLFLKTLKPLLIVTPWCNPILVSLLEVLDSPVGPEYH